MRSVWKGIFFAIVAGFGPLAQPATALTPAELSRYEATCRHFDNRARFKQRKANAELVVRLAESCRTALSSLTGPQGGADRTNAPVSRGYLDALTEFKTLYIRIVVGTGKGPSGFLNKTPNRVRRIGLTQTGEYLIARHMGLLGAYDHWARATGFRITLQD